MVLKQDKKCNDETSQPGKHHKMVPNERCTLWVKKRHLYTFAHNFGRCSRIFEIFPCWIHQEICNKL